MSVDEHRQSGKISAVFNYGKDDKEGGHDRKYDGNTIADPEGDDPEFADKQADKALTGLTK